MSVIDLGPILDQLKADLRDELRAELLQERRAELAWPEYMSIKTASRYLDMTTERLRKLVLRGQMPVIQEGPRCRVFFERGALDHWMQSMRQPPPALSPSTSGDLGNDARKAASQTLCKAEETP